MTAKRKLFLNAKKIDNFLKKYFKKQKKSRLIKSMKYGTLSGGKKIRSSVILNTGRLFNLNPKSPPVALPTTCPLSYIGLLPRTSASETL